MTDLPSTMSPTETTANGPHADSGLEAPQPEGSAPSLPSIQTREDARKRFVNSERAYRLHLLNGDPNWASASPRGPELGRGGIIALQSDETDDVPTTSPQESEPTSGDADLDTSAAESEPISDAEIDRLADEVMNAGRRTIFGIDRLAPDDGDARLEHFAGVLDELDDDSAARLMGAVFESADNWMSPEDIQRLTEEGRLTEDERSALANGLAGAYNHGAIDESQVTDYFSDVIFPPNGFPGRSYQESLDFLSAGDGPQMEAFYEDYAQALIQRDIESSPQIDPTTLQSSAVNDGLIGRYGTAFAMSLADQAQDPLTAARVYESTPEALRPTLLHNLRQQGAGLSQNPVDGLVNAVGHGLNNPSTANDFAPLAEELVSFAGHPLNFPQDDTVEPIDLEAVLDGTHVPSAQDLVNHINTLRGAVGRDGDEAFIADSDLSAFGDLSEDERRFYAAVLHEQQQMVFGDDADARRNYQFNVMDHAAHIAGNDGNDFIDLVSGAFSAVANTYGDSPQAALERAAAGAEAHPAGQYLESGYNWHLKGQGEGAFNDGFNPLVHGADGNDTISHHFGAFLTAHGVGHVDRYDLVTRRDDPMDDAGDVRNGYFAVMLGDGLQRGTVTPGDAAALTRWAFDQDHGGSDVAPPWGSTLADARRSEYLSADDYRGQLETWVDAYNAANPDAPIVFTP